MSGGDKCGCIPQLERYPRSGGRRTTLGMSRLALGLTGSGDRDDITKRKIYIDICRNIINSIKLDKNHQPPITQGVHITIIICNEFHIDSYTNKFPVNISKVLLLNEFFLVAFFFTIIIITPLADITH